jgi:putative membrane protein
VGRQTFFTKDAKTKLVGAIRAVESLSSAEIVVSLRTRSDDYREVDFAAGLVLALVTLALLIYHPAELDEELMPVETLLAFVIGSISVNKIGALKRALTSKKKQHARMLTAARANFVEAGVSRTRDRSGILVFISELERAVCVVPDIGIDPDKLGDGWRAKLAVLENAAANLDIGAFVAALTELGPLLATEYPRREDDVNELPDAPMVEGAR